MEHLVSRHQFRASYTPQDSPTERNIRTVKGDHRCWDERWPELMLAVSSGVAESTGYSPAFVVQGREPRLPKALYDAETIGPGQPETEEARLWEEAPRASNKRDPRQRERSAESENAAAAPTDGAVPEDAPKKNGQTERPQLGRQTSCPGERAEARRPERKASWPRRGSTSNVVIKSGRPSSRALSRG
ncbi:GL20683 [Drosophila persimilis]|uniref:GL20683 n=1 Tax=Drosophila persimilis TaxID=7234 RepID=B4IRN9_DROPE|nr:GL20683 [Drosophila persimilis]